jgi:hypothetical protein
LSLELLRFAPLRPSKNAYSRNYEFLRYPLQKRCSRATLRFEYSVSGKFRRLLAYKVSEDGEKFDKVD